MHSARSRIKILYLALCLQRPAKSLGLNFLQELILCEDGVHGLKWQLVWGV